MKGKGRRKWGSMCVVWREKWKEGKNERKFFRWDPLILILPKVGGKWRGEGLVFGLIEITNSLFLLILIIRK